MYRTIHEVRRRNLTYIEESALEDLFTAVSKIEKRGMRGALVETGCALGGSSIVLASAKSRSRDFFIYDIFGMIPQPSEKDGMDVFERYRVIKEGKSDGINGDEYYGYQKNLYEKVILNFDEFDLKIEENAIHLVKGLYQNSLRINFKVALAHIDCDWYDSVIVCLNQIVPNLSKGGVLILDDYNIWSGCTKAVDDYFFEKKELFEFVHKSRLHIIKK